MPKSPKSTSFLNRVQKRINGEIVKQAQLVKAIEVLSQDEVDSIIESVKQQKISFESQKNAGKGVSRVSFSTKIERFWPNMEEKYQQATVKLLALGYDEKQSNRLLLRQSPQSAIEQLLTQHHKLLSTLRAEGVDAK